MPGEMVTPRCPVGAEPGRLGMTLMPPRGHLGAGPCGRGRSVTLAAVPRAWGLLCGSRARWLPCVCAQCPRPTSLCHILFDRWDLWSPCAEEVEDQRS